MIGSILLLIGGLILGFIGITVLASAKGAIHEVAAFCLITASSVAVSSAFIVSYLNTLIKEVRNSVKVPPLPNGNSTDANSRIISEQQRTNELMEHFLSRFE